MQCLTAVRFAKIEGKFFKKTKKLNTSEEKAFAILKQGFIALKEFHRAQQRNGAVSLHATTNRESPRINGSAIPSRVFAKLKNIFIITELDEETFKTKFLHLLLRIESKKRETPQLELSL